MADETRKIPEQQARALWQRAIQLQQAAEQKPASARALTSAEASGYSLEQIVESAEGAGVDREFIRLAVAEARLPDSVDADPDRWTARVMRRVTKAPPALEVTGLVDAPADAAVSAFRTVASRPAYEMELVDRVGPDPPLDGVSVYRIESSSWNTGHFHGAMQLADARVMFVTASPAGERTLFRLRLPFFEHGVNLTITGVMAGGMGSVGAYGGTAAGASLAGVLGTASLAVIAAPATIGAVVGGALGVAGFRSLQRWGTRKGVVALQRLLQAVQLEARESS